MIESNNLSASELLTAFIDGELDSSRSQLLFYQLANDSELQSEMQELINIRTAFKNSALQPPPDMQNKIIKNTVYSNGFVSKFAYIPALVSTLLFNKVAAVVSSVLLIGSIFFMTQYFQDNSEADLVNNSVNEIVPITQNSVDKVSSDTGKNNISSSDINQTVPVVTSTHNLQNDVSDRIADNNETVSEDNNTNSYIEENSFKTVTYSNGFNGNINAPTPQINRKDYITFYGLKNTLNKFFNKLSVSFNKQALFTSIQPDVNNEEKPILNDFSIAFNYEMNDNNHIGFDVGREYFPMVFTGTENLKNRNVKYEYPLSYNALWAGISYKYSFDPLNYYLKFQPNARITLGGTTLGPLTKLAIGSDIYLSDNFALYAGLKYGALFYNYQGNIFVTNKYGLDYGLLIRF